MKKGMAIILLAAFMLTACSDAGADSSSDAPVVNPRTISDQNDSEDTNEDTDDSTSDVTDSQTAMSAEDEARYMKDARELEESLREYEEINRNNKEVINIEEKIYLSQMTDIYMNTEDYVGRIISMEGYMLPDEEDDDIVGAVVRDTPGCCGDDGLTGISFIWDGDCPEDNDWLKVTGVLTFRCTEEGDLYLVIEADEAEVLTERGREFVSQ